MTLWDWNRLSCNKEKEKKYIHSSTFVEGSELRVPDCFACNNSRIICVENSWRDSLVSENLVCSDRETKPLVSSMRVVKRLALETSSWLAQKSYWLIWSEL